jgi:ribosomal protein S18 acetylase RimI-like enzyme
MNISFRNKVNQEDVKSVETIIRSSGFFREDEVAIACELVEERLKKGIQSGYEFLFAETAGITVAFTCFGMIPCSLVSYDLYWIATSQEYRNKGIGKKILAETEEIVKQAGGRAIYIETSSKPDYEPTRVFYRLNGYKVMAELKDYYDVGDNKLIYAKRFT